MYMCNIHSFICVTCDEILWRRIFFPTQATTPHSTPQSFDDESTPDTHSSTRVTWPIYMRDVWYNSLVQDFIFLSHWRLRPNLLAMKVLPILTHLHVWHDSFIYVKCVEILWRRIFFFLTQATAHDLLTTKALPILPSHASTAPTAGG